MKKTTSFLLPIVIISISLASCRAIFYTPNRNPVPLFKEKGDLYIDASTNMANKGDLTIGYAITDGLAGYAGFGLAQEQFHQSDTSTGVSVERKYLYNGEMLNLGLGYFVNQTQSKNLRFEVFGDIGLGSFRNKVSGNDNQYFNGKYTRIGIMPNIGYTSNNNKFNIAYSARLSTISFSNTSVSDSNFWRDDINRLNKRSSYGMLEHGITMRGGLEFIKLQAQLSLYHGLNSREVSDAIPKFNYSLMLGIVINTNLFIK